LRVSATAAPRALGDEEFEALRRLVREHTGIELHDGKRGMVYGRLLRRLRGLQLSGFDAYLHMLERDDAELARFINAMTTNVTSFFREPHHFDLLGATVVPAWLARRSRANSLRVWSAGCSTGQEPYSIAMTLAECFEHERPPVKVLATDLDSDVLDHAQAGWYAVDQVSGISPQRLARWFVPEQRDGEDGYRAIASLRGLVMFKQLNLMQHWPIRPPVDLIYCRNVMIYFRRETQRALIERFAALQDANGHMCVGHSESLLGIAPEYELIGRTAYRRRPA
jgi:chemotaxis protein methyltransferase CheR